MKGQCMIDKFTMGSEINEIIGKLKDRYKPVRLELGLNLIKVIL